MQVKLGGTRRRRPVALVGLGLTALLATSLQVLAGSASAIGAPVAFGALALPTWQTNGTVLASATSGDLVFAAGKFSRIRPPGEGDLITTTTGGVTTTRPNPLDLERSNVAVLDAATGTPTSCVLDVTGSSAQVRAMDVSPDGSTLYLGGFFSAVDGVARTNLAAVDVASCTVLTTWHPSTSGFVNAVKAGTQTVWVGGGFVTIGGANRTRVAALDAFTGAVSQAFNTPFDGTSHTLTVPDVDAIALKPDGSALVIGGNFDSVGGAPSHALAVVDPTDGHLLQGFDGVIQGYQSEFNFGSAVKGIAVDSTGFYVGAEGTGRFVFDGRLAFNWGAVSPRWKDGCLGATQALVRYGSLLYVGGHSHDCTDLGAFGDGQRRHLLAETVVGGKPVLQGWTPDTNDGVGEGVGPRSLTVASPGNGTDYLWSTGEFTTVNGVAQQGLTRFATGDQRLGPAIFPLLTVTSDEAGKARLAARTATDLDDSSLTYSFFRDAATTPFFVTSAASFPWSMPQLTVTDTQPAGSTHSYHVTANDGTTTVSSPTVSIKVAAATSAYLLKVRASSPLIHLRYDDVTGPYLSDATSNGNDLRINLATANGFRKPGALRGDPSTSGSFSGSNQSYAVSEKRFASPAGAFSLETWFRTATGGGKLIGFSDSQQLESQEFDSRSADFHDPDKMIYLTNSGLVVFGTEGTPGQKKVVATRGTYLNGRWHHVVAVQDTGGAQPGMKLYVDGVLLAQNTVTTHGGGTGYWRVGGDAIRGWPISPGGSPTRGYFTGYLDETAVYYRALSAAEVSAHYAAGH